VLRLHNKVNRVNKNAEKESGSRFITENKSENSRRTGHACWI